jgi:Asp-tRNA(Asn)/Glu-tRNA(Gln) amidotransferase A subunit family amidase
MNHARFTAFAAATAMAALALQAQAATFDLATATLVDINAAIDAGALSSEKLVGMYLKRIEAYDKQGPKINSVITLNPKALAEARALDAERKKTGRRSQLHGIPVMIKDLIDVAGLPTTAGYKPFGAPIPLRDAGVVARLHDAGAIVLAKVATVNWFGKGFDDTHPIGRTLNPYNVDYTPGGSSNGPGAAMAAYFATLSIGTDTGGSVQIPSAYNSIAGMVATQGMVTRTGIVPRGPTQDRAGPMARSIYDVAATLSVIAGWDAEDGDTLNGMSHFPESDWSKQLGKPDLNGKRIGVLREMFNTGPYDDEVKAIFERALDDMRKAGAIIIDPVLTGLDLRTVTSNAVLSTSHPRVGDKTLPYELVPATNAYLARLGPVRPWQTLQDMVKKVGPEKLSAEYYNSPNFTAPDKMPDYVSRMQLRTVVTKQVSDTIEKLQLDAVVLPYQSVPPPPWEASKDKYAGGDRSNNFTSATGLPGIIVPGGYTKDNLPVAIQFAARYWDDLKLLQVAYGYEQSSKRRKTPATTPPLPGEVFEYQSRVMDHQ